MESCYVRFGTWSFKSRIRHHGPPGPKDKQTPKLISYDHIIKQRLCCLGTGHHKTQIKLLLDIHPQRNNLSYKGKEIVSAYTAQIHSGK
jgi:hypothetical protein